MLTRQAASETIFILKLVQTGLFAIKIDPSNQYKLQQLQQFDFQWSIFIEDTEIKKF